MVSIIILVQDRYNLVKRCIDSIIEYTKIPYELILIQQGDITNKLLVDYLDDLRYSELGLCKSLKHIINPINTGVTPGRNQGIENSSGDYLLFFDDDAYISIDDEFQSHIPEEEKHLDWLSMLLKYFWNNPKVGVVSQGGSYINPDTPGVFWACIKRGGYCDVGQGYCFMFSREVVNSIGNLDPYFGKFWHEESEYALRAKASGFKVINSGYVGVIHFGSGSGDDGTYGDKINYMFRKWKPYFNKILEPRESWNL